MLTPTISQCGALPEPHDRASRNARAPYSATPLLEADREICAKSARPGVKDPAAFARAGDALARGLVEVRLAAVGFVDDFLAMIFAPVKGSDDRC